MQTGLTRQRTTHYEDTAKNNRVKNLNQQRQEEKEWREMQTARRLNRVYEVEEHMGSEFLEELARLHQEHLNILRHNMTFTIDLDSKKHQER